jgi:hypothetical protein
MSSVRGGKLGRWYLMAVLVCTWPVFAVAGEAPVAERSDVTELLRLSGATDIAKELTPFIARQFMLALQQSNRGLSSRAILVINQVVNQYLSDQARADELTSELAPIYEKIFSPAEIKELIAFYGSPVGRKLAASLPEITAQSAQVGQAWATKIMPGLRSEVLGRLRSEGLIAP